MIRIISLLTVLATAGCAAVAPSPPPAAPPQPASSMKSVERPWDDNRIEALLAYHARVTGYRKVCWDAQSRRPVRCYDI